MRLSILTAIAALSLAASAHAQVAISPVTQHTPRMQPMIRPAAIYIDKSNVLHVAGSLFVVTKYRGKLSSNDRSDILTVAAGCTGSILPLSGDYVGNTSDLHRCLRTKTILVEKVAGRMRGIAFTTLVHDPLPA